jgi:glycosyltransferase involved in cell wall biosynthesis
VSVVIPAYNAERTLGDTIRSVLDQTFQDLEIIVVNDGSQDATAEIARGFGQRVQCISTPNGGVSRARNLGIDAAEGSFLTFLDADDQWEHDKLARQVRLLADRPDAGGAYTGFKRVDDSQRTIGEAPARFYSDLCEALLLFSGLVNMSSLLIRRSFDTQFDPRFSQCADWDYCLRLSKVTTLVAIPDLLVRYRSSPGRMSSDIGLLEHDSFAVLDSFFSGPLADNYRHLRQRVYSNHRMILAGSYLHAGNLKSSLRNLGLGLALYPPNARRPLGAPLRWARRLAAGRPALAGP